MGEKQEKVLLHTAFWWECPGCGTQNFDHGSPMELSDDERKELHRMHGVPEDDEGEWMGAPEKVTCSGCRRTFDAQHDSDLLQPDPAGDDDSD
ncbi:MAG: hypothetical protein JSS51_03455 [Planctomycetes bacterium]|nr:hypothetical protein [Planctomycetota bacterium]